MTNTKTRHSTLRGHIIKDNSGALEKIIEKFPLNLILEECIRHNACKCLQMFINKKAPKLRDVISCLSMIHVSHQTLEVLKTYLEMLTPYNIKKLQFGAMQSDNSLAYDYFVKNYDATLFEKNDYHLCVLYTKPHMLAYFDSIIPLKDRVGLLDKKIKNKFYVEHFNSLVCELQSKTIYDNIECELGNKENTKRKM